SVSALACHESSFFNTVGLGTRPLLNHSPVTVTLRLHRAYLCLATPIVDDVESCYNRHQRTRVERLIAWAATVEELEKRLIRVEQEVTGLRQKLGGAIDETPA